MRERITMEPKLGDLFKVVIGPMLGPPAFRCSCRLKLESNGWWNLKILNTSNSRTSLQSTIRLVVANDFMSEILRKCVS